MAVAAAAGALTLRPPTSALPLPPLRMQLFPWLKIIASMREPISRTLSMLAHNLDLHSKGCLAK